ncbi:lactate dehydrogenase [Vibrio sp. 10N.286.49.C2]|uniref:LutC/YkgG family protein n=1 Tax=unclassified Vibrio TaxID=2614977 RepID=UPI000C836109|nr:MULTISPECIES: lactate utilization protein [unclassified Vibrio]PMH43339.1 lactate dehydrogenase [Vibrio sp. 10N.286.49.C2]PMH56991.1 lactate dehydrogenase [Vibrio sp. 10N.286.49.B1]PMH79127.1 lactate dehydrogenase [Vibrio sp. 10N.286.48.B7]
MNTRQTKERILDRLKNAPRSSNSSPQNGAYLPWGSDPNLTPDDYTERFIGMMTANHTDVKITTRASLVATLRQTVEEYQLNNVAIGTAGEYIEAFHDATSQIQVTEFSDKIEEWKSELFDQIDAGITHTFGGIADTGALILWPTEHEPRTLSLIPPCHIAVIKKSALFANFPQAMAKGEWSHYMPTNALLISGPSKTADIQQTLAYGAHGPSQLIVIFLEDE